MVFLSLEAFVLNFRRFGFEFMNKILEGLNENQLEAVVNIEGPVLVLAGAGSGKTRVLTHRVAHMLEQSISPWNVLAITFTNKAAKEMRERIEKLIFYGNKKPYDLWVCTFHSASLRILRAEIEKLGYKKDFVIYDTSDQQTLLKECIKELNLDEKRFNSKGIAFTISAAKNKFMSPEDFEKQAFNYVEQIIAKVYALYQQKLYQNNALDFDDLLLLTVRLFQQDDEALKYYQERFKYILIDEYQDTNNVQYIFAKLLADRYKNICVVGDPNQSIYRWRGADVSNIKNFERDYPNAKVIKLERNYRSTQTILDAANAVIANNSKLKNKDLQKNLRLWTAHNKGKQITVHCCEDENDEALFVAEVIKRGVQTKRSYREFAVLYRTNAQSRAIEEIFVRNNIPYNIVGGLKFYERKEIKDLMAYLQLLINPYDTLSFKRIVNVPKRGIGSATVNKFISYVLMPPDDEKSITLIDVLRNAENIAGISTKARTKAQELVAVFDSINRQIHELSIVDIMNMVLDLSGYRSALEAEATVESRTRLENLNEFITVAAKYDLENPDGDLGDFLASISLMTDQDKYENSNVVSLMTLHTAKGLEFPVVFIVGMEEGIFPHFRSFEDDAEMEEERRICYVGITRAKEELYLSYCKMRNLYGRTQMNKPSRFLREIPEELIAPFIKQKGLDNEAKDSDLIGSSIDNKAFYNNKQAVTEESFQLGDKVVHKKWGAGVIVGIKGDGRDMQATVAFPEHGIKVLMLQYADLQRV